MGILLILGLQLRFGQAVDIEMLTLLRDQVGELCQAVKTWNLGKEEVCKFHVVYYGRCLLRRKLETNCAIHFYTSVQY